MCRTLGVSRSGFDDWLPRTPSRRAPVDERLATCIRAHFEANRQVDGTRRLTDCLADDGPCVSRRRIARLMRQQALKVQTRRPYKVTTDSSQGQVIAPNVLNRPCTVEEPDTADVGDITAIRTAEGWLYLAVVIDLFSRAVVGWAMSHQLKANRVVTALQMAIDPRQPRPGLLRHTDRGAPYVSDRY